MMKRALDIIIGSGALVVSLPVIAVAAVAIKFTSRGPILYRAKRAGRNGEPIDVLKLRTMRVATDSRDRRVTAEKDDRITRVGRVLRKLKIDELPQFWNVVVGDMAIVGPRPEDWDIVRDHFTEEQRKTLSVRPGIASSADVRWYPDLTYHDPPPEGISMQEYYISHHMPAQLEESLRYVEQQSLLLDLKLMAQMAFCVLVRSWRPPAKQPPSYAGLVDDAAKEATP